MYFWSNRKILNQRQFYYQQHYLMISFCQDLSISYQSSIYQNPTAKRIIHKRNDSKISQKPLNKQHKLFLVSKDKQKLNLQHQFNRFVANQNHKTFNELKPSYIKNNQHSIPNHLNKESIIIPPSQKIINYHFQKEHSKKIVIKQLQPIEYQRVTYRPRVFFNKFQQKKLGQRNDVNKILNHTHAQPPQKVENSTKKVVFLKKQSIKYNQSQQSTTIRIQQSLQNLNQGIQIKPNYQSYSNRKNPKSENHSKSLSSNKIKSTSTHYQTPSITFNNKLIIDKKATKFNKNVFFTPKQNSLICNFEDQMLLTPKQKQKSQKVNKLEFFYSPQFQNKIMIPKVEIPLEKSPQQISFLFDTESVISKEFEEQDDQCTSIVEQRNFFFEKEENPKKVFKKSIDKFLFLEPPYIPQNSKWLLFNRVKEKENKKLYSIKEFSTQNQKQYLNEYEIYLALKAQVSHIMSNNNQKPLFLNLYNALSNSQQKKLYLVKDSFDYMLTEFIDKLKAENSHTFERRKIFYIQIQHIQSEIALIFQFFSAMGIQIAVQEEIQIEDFVVFQSFTGIRSIIFHSLQKLQKFHNNVQSEKIFKKTMTIIVTQQEKEQRRKRKIESLYQKIKIAFILNE